MHRYLYLFGNQYQWYTVLGKFYFFPILFFNLSQYNEKKENLSVVSERIQKYFQKKLKLNSHFRFLEKKSFWTIVEIIVFTILQYYTILLSTGIIGDLFNTGGNYFGCFLLFPYILLVSYWLFGLDPLKQSDLITPSFPLSLIFIKLACFCAGCCHGIESNRFGMYNYATSAMEIPVQLIETGWGLILFILLFAIRKKVKPGTLYPLYTILYSATRFCSEFLRHEENILGPLKKYHIFCIAGIVIGIIQYIVVTKYGEQIRAFIQPGLIGLIEKLKEKLKKRKKANRKAKKKNKNKNKNKGKKRA
ncbi:MAG: prolipoprotein diacylglyceryl transferase [Clostridia bacterium]|nr:prolipoprotein diacylglyceryl transferase [Clostridia bacterium]